jgi:response regulator RpfG family c-di-GMP phosphodiesterase
MQCSCGLDPIHRSVGRNQLRKILVIDDDHDVRGLHRARLSDTYEIVETGEPEQALSLALEHKPDAILLDLMMPKCSGFELCQTLHSLSYTSTIPILIVSGESGDQYKAHCESLGARGFFEKPVDYKQLKARLAAELQDTRPDRRAHVRVRMRVLLTLRGTDASGNKFETSVATDNVSAGGFLCSCTVPLLKDAVVDVFFTAPNERFAGRARLVRRESAGAPWQQYGFQFTELSNEWFLRP